MEFGSESEYERAFRKAGLPLLTEDYSPAQDIFNRAVPLLGLVILLKVLAPLNSDWTFWQNLVAVVVSLGVILAALGLVNRLRGRSFFSRPSRVGPAELAAFVIVPALLPGLFVALGSALLFARLPKVVASLEQSAGGDGPPLDHRQRFSVGLVLFVSQSLQILLVALAVAGFFIVFGLLTVNADLIANWIKATPEVLFGFRIGEREAEVTTELLRVAGALAAFTGLYFAISMLTDELYRREFLSQITTR